MDGGVIDIHTHAFPDRIAEGAMAKLCGEVEGIAVYLDGKLGSLLRSMDDNSIDKSVLCNIATRAGQFDSIFKWCLEIASSDEVTGDGRALSERIVPFASVHPDDEDIAGKLWKVKDAGLKGIKMHPYYQGFDLDEERMGVVYENVSELGLVLVMHTGYDIAFERVDRAGPERVINIIEDFGDLKLVTTHMGAWEQWEDVCNYIVGRDIYMDISYSFGFIEQGRAEYILQNHGWEYLLFGTDSPWDDQGEAVERVRGLKMGKEFERLVLRDNALRLLGL
jgi:hypothetical protein